VVPRFGDLSRRLVPAGRRGAGRSAVVPNARRRRRNDDEHGSGGPFASRGRERRGKSR